MGRKAVVRATPYGGWNRDRAEHRAEHLKRSGARRGPREGPALAGGDRHLHASRLRTPATPRWLQRLLLPVPRLSLRRVRPHPPRPRARQPSSTRLRVHLCRPHPRRLMRLMRRALHLTWPFFSLGSLLRVARLLDLGWISGLFCIPLRRNDDLRPSILSKLLVKKR